MSHWYREIRSLLENVEGTIPVLYHGTCPANAKNILENGWQPNSGSTGGNMGQARYLYMSTGAEDAEWFANEKGCGTVIKAENVPISSLIVDPEDGTGDSVQEEIEMAEKHGMPAKLALRRPLPASAFSIHKA